MYFISQAFIYLALALIIGGAIGYAFRACLADTACDDVRDDLALARSQYEALLESQHASQTRQVIAQSSRNLPNPANELAGTSSRDFEQALLSAAPGTSLKSRFGADDLTAIVGITPKMDVWLGLQGITRFSHIANLSAAELFWIVENMPENGASVYRDHWVAQASKLVGVTPTT